MDSLTQSEQGDASRRAIIAAVRELTREGGRPPTYREVLARVPFSSLGTLRRNVGILIDEGKLRRLPGDGPRCLAVVEESPEGTTGTPDAKAQS